MKTGKIHKVKVSSLSHEDGQPITMADIEEGVELLMDFNKKSYRVKFIGIGDSVNGKFLNIIRYSSKY